MLRPLRFISCIPTSPRPMKVLANPYPRTPTMAAGISDHVWTCDELRRYWTKGEDGLHVL